VVKLKSGYNVGVRITPDVKIEKIGKGTKPSFASPPLPEQKPELPKAVILSTGGTIASRVDYRTGAVRSALSASDLYGVVPELADIVRIKTEIVFSLYSENLTQQHWTQLAQKVAEHIKQGADGVVIPHGTDTMAYTAAALSFALRRNQPYRRSPSRNKSAVCGSRLSHARNALRHSHSHQQRHKSEEVPH